MPATLLRRRFLHWNFSRAPPSASVTSLATSTNRAHFEANSACSEQVKVSNGRHGDVVDGNERDLRSADVYMSRLDGQVDFHVLLSKVILRGPALLPRRQTRGSLVAVRTCGEVDERRADTVHDDGDGRNHQGGPFDVKIVVPSGPHLRRHVSSSAGAHLQPGLRRRASQTQQGNIFEPLLQHSPSVVR